MALNLITYLETYYRASLCLLEKTLTKIHCKDPMMVHIEFFLVAKKTFLVDLGGRPDVISLDRLKAVYKDSDFPVPVAQPKRRGRPPKKFTKDN